MRLRTVPVLGVPLSVADIDAAADSVIAAAGTGASACVCAVNVHSTMEATRDAALLLALQGSDLNVPDGVPIVWGMRALGAPGQQRVFGPTLMWEVCRRAAATDIPVALYGSTDETLTELRATLSASFPGLRIVAAISPPFRPLSDAEDSDMVASLNASGARIVFVGLGAPKQEKWMAAHRGGVNAVMLGVGAAFDYHAGRIRRAPVWMQHAGLEWLYRLIQEPRRLWRRYVFNNPAYLGRLGIQILRERVFRVPRARAR
jgi:N-acetylglucosaminyldiphosphoundecaprenol N-acetyl-beta-D-mannosaminyltransferase